MLYYLVCGDEDVGVRDAMLRGYVRIAINRFATAEKDDVRIVRRFTDMIPLAGVTPLVRGSDFAKNAEAARFEEFVQSGSGRWV